MTDANAPDDAQLFARIGALLSAAVASLDPADRDERTEWCRANNAPGVRMHPGTDDDVIRFDWGGKSLLLVRRDDLLSDTPIRLEHIDLPDNLEGFTP